MISLDIFNNAESKLINLARLWNSAEANPVLYDRLFESNPHELAALIGNYTTYMDWQEFIADSRVQEYIDKIIYTRAGIIINQSLNLDAHLSQADSARLSAAIKYRDDHKADFAVPVQYIYIQTPLTYDEKQFLPNVPENANNI